MLKPSPPPRIRALLGVAQNIRTLLESYQAEQKRNANITTIADMQTFMERYPAFRAQSHSVSKHVAVMTELFETKPLYFNRLGSGEPADVAAPAA